LVLPTSVNISIHAEIVSMKFVAELFTRRSHEPECPSVCQRAAGVDLELVMVYSDAVRLGVVRLMAADIPVRVQTQQRVRKRVHDHSGGDPSFRVSRHLIEQESDRAIRIMNLQRAIRIVQGGSHDVDVGEGGMLFVPPHKLRGRGGRGGCRKSVACQ